MNDLESPSTRFDRGSNGAYDRLNPSQFCLPDASKYRPPESRRPTNARGSYFEARPSVVPSPTASLVADLSSNFHLGASPAVPTPCRSLMAQFQYHEQRSAAEVLEPLYTPDEMQSSPGELMDTSPVPMVARRTLARTTSMFEPAQMSSFTNDLIPRKETTTQRPSLGPRNAFSSFAVPALPECKSSSFSRLTTNNADDKENNLASQFEDSPKKTPRKFFNLGFSRKGQEMSPPSGDDMIQRSPLAPISANANLRRLPQFRRTQSMVTKNDDFLLPDLPHNTPAGRPQQQSPMSPEQQMTTCQILPSFQSKQDQLHVRRITGLTLAKVLEGQFKDLYDKLEIIDCRFPHEYEGGHIPRAINISSLDAMDRHPLLKSPLSCRTLIILHCEYSAHRAPRIAAHLRSRDRTLNSHRYPQLFYPEVYILDGGYSNFYREFRLHVGTSGYVEMNDPSHKPFASRQMHDFRKNTKFQRTQSYTFGQEDSPLVGGARMEREMNFKLKPPESNRSTNPLFRSSSSNVLEFQRPVNVDLTMSDIDPDDSGEGCSMMDVDETSMNSPVPTYANTSNNTFQRTHARTSSGRIDPRRLCSF